MQTTFNNFFYDEWDELDTLLDTHGLYKTASCYFTWDAVPNEFCLYKPTKDENIFIGVVKVTQRKIKFTSNKRCEYIRNNGKRVTNQVFIEWLLECIDHSNKYKPVVSYP